MHKDTKNLDKLELAGILFFLLICPVSTYTLIWLALNFEYAKFAVKKFAGVDVVEILSSNKNLVKDKLDIVLANIPRSSSVTKKND